MWLLPANSPVTGRSPNTPARSGTQNRARCHEEDPAMTISPLAGKPAPKEMLIDPVQLEREYYARRPDLDDPEQRVSVGTSAHRRSPLPRTLTQAHIPPVA